jgi:hypothetical protein
MKFINIKMICKTCGENMIGDGYTTPYHCPNIDIIGSGIEPDANPIHCIEDFYIVGIDNIIEIDRDVMALFETMFKPLCEEYHENS